MILRPRLFHRIDTSIGDNGKSIIYKTTAYGITRYNNVRIVMSIGVTIGNDLKLQLQLNEN